MTHVIKADGRREQFSEEKLRTSTTRAQVPIALQHQVIEHIKKHLYENIPTAEIYHHIGEFLASSPAPFSKARYSLKQAIMGLGPTGYPFENLVEKLLTAQGFTTQIRQTLYGTCISHEIDVIAEKHTVLPTKIMIEAKFHNILGIPTNVHVPMYSKARFDDIKEKHGFTEVMLITNTKATSDAIRYAECIGMEIISWSYPQADNLRELVEKFHLYPVTALTTISVEQKQTLLQRNIILCKEICEDPTILTSLGLPKERTDVVMQEIAFICGITT